MTGLKFTTKPGGCGVSIRAEESGRAAKDGGLESFMPVASVSCGDRYHGAGSEHEFFHQCEKCYEKERREAAAAAA
jgi:hypothetical protein